MRFEHRLAPWRFGTAALLALGLSLWSAPARAQGFGLYEQGACMMGRDGAGVAAPCDDGSAVFFNPAALASATRPVVSFGGEAIAPRGSFTNSTSGLVSPLSQDTYFAPAVYVTVPTSRVAFGVGLFAPYGLTSDWPNTSEGRFLGYHSSLKGIYVQPTVAVKLSDNVMIGAGLDITHLSLELRRRIDLASTQIPGSSLPFAVLGVRPGTDFADVRLSGTGDHIGAHFGVMFKASDAVSFGARYLTRQTVDVSNGSITTTQINTGLRTPVPLPGIPAGTPLDALLAAGFASGQPLGAQTATTSLALPDQFVAGVALKPAPGVGVFIDYQYVHWAVFDQVLILNQYAPATDLVMNYRDTHGVRVGTEFNVAHQVALRAGFDAHTAAAPDESVTPLLPEAPRAEVTFGAGVPLGFARLDLAYMYIHQSDRAGRTIDGPNNGTYHYYGNLLGASLVLRF